MFKDSDNYRLIKPVCWCAQIVVVTGGNQGLGLETAKALAVAGAHVVVATRTQIKAEQCASGIRC